MVGNTRHIFNHFQQTPKFPKRPADDDEKEQKRDYFQPKIAHARGKPFYTIREKLLIQLLLCSPTTVRGRIPSRHVHSRMFDRLPLCPIPVLLVLYLIPSASLSLFATQKKQGKKLQSSLGHTFQWADRSFFMFQLKIGGCQSKRSSCRIHRRVQPNHFTQQ